MLYIKYFLTLLVAGVFDSSPAQFGEAGSPKFSPGLGPAGLFPRKQETLSSHSCNILFVKGETVLYKYCFT